MADPDAGAADNAPGPPRPAPSFAVPFDSAAAPWNVHKEEWLRARGLAWDGIATGALVYYHDDGDDDDDDDNNNNNNNEQAGEREREGGGSRTRVLLLQRSGDDEFPNLWETPGGAVDAEDPTILQGCARELWEETGLVAERVVRVVTEGRWGRKGWRGGVVEGEAVTAGAPERVEDSDRRGPALPYEQAGSVFQNETRTRTYCKFAFEVSVVKKNNTTTTTTAPPEVRLDPAEHQRFVWASEEEVRAGRCGSRITLPFTVMQMRNMLLEGFRLRREEAERARKGRVGG